MCGAIINCRKTYLSDPSFQPGLRAAASDSWLYNSHNYLIMIKRLFFYCQRKIVLY